MGITLLQQRHGFLAVQGLLDFEAMLFQQVAQLVSLGLTVFDDQYREGFVFVEP